MSSPLDLVRVFAHGAMGRVCFMVDPLSYFSFQPVLHDWCNKGCGMCYPVCVMLLIRLSSLCGGSRFSLSLSEWSLPYDRCHITVNKMC